MRGTSITLTGTLLLTLFFVLGFSPLILNGSTAADTSQQNVNIVVGGLFLLVFIKLLVAGILGYLWYRNSKFKKQKVILDV